MNHETPFESNIENERKHSQTFGLSYFSKGPPALFAVMSDQRVNTGLVLGDIGPGSIDFSSPFSGEEPAVALSSAADPQQPQSLALWKTGNGMPARILLPYTGTTCHE